MKIIFDDNAVRESLWPLTATRNAADIRVGILTLREKWEMLFSKQAQSTLWNGCTIQTQAIISSHTKFIAGPAGIIEIQNEVESCKPLVYPWNVFQYNDWALRNDFEWITAGRVSQPISATNQVISPENIFLEEGAIVECSVINASTGPVYIGKNATIMEGTLIRGPLALCEGATLKMGAKVYGATTIGPYCIAGGEIKNAVLFGYSNKAHDGYLGESVIGEWCNLGAGTTNSNVKNTAGEVKMWSNAKRDFIASGTKAGLIMGDYSRAAINTAFNTGTVVGVCCNIFSEGFPPKLVNNFTWGTEKYELSKAFKDIDNWKRLKGKSLTKDERNFLQHLYNQSN